MHVPQYKVAMFAPHLNAEFLIHFEGGEVVRLVLEGIKPLSEATRSHPDREAFALYFRDHERTTAYLLQQIYPITHPTLGVMELFIVPIEVTAMGALYECIFT